MPKEATDAMDSAIPIFVADDEAKRFLLFMEHHQVFDAMLEADAFTVQWGKVVLNFGSGRVQSVSVEKVHRL